MKNIFYILIILILFSCDKENGSDCFQSTGNIILTEFEVAPFSIIQFEDDVSVVLKQDNIQKVVIETGENLLNDVSVKVENETLIIQDNNGCNLFRDYGVTKAYINIPNLTKIRNASSGEITSEGTLNFPNITLTSNSSENIEGVRKSGDFILNLISENLTISANGQSIFYLTGETQIADIVFSDEWPRLEGESFKIDSLSILQRSATYMKVLPLHKISGEIRGTGNVLLYHTPNIIEVEEFFTGKLIIQD